jgi:hypothetical protein
VTLTDPRPRRVHKAGYPSTEIGQFRRYPPKSGGRTSSGDMARRRRVREPIIHDAAAASQCDGCCKLQLTNHGGLQT